MKNTQNKDLGFETYRVDAPFVVNREEKSFTATIATEAPIMLQGWKYGEQYEEFTETLRCTPDAIMTDRLDIGLPLFESHFEREAEDLRGISTSYEIANGQLIATFKLGARADEALLLDLENKVLKSVSIGCNIYNVMRLEIDGKISYTALKWQPKHVAFAPEPADVNCTVRSTAKVEGQITKPQIEKDLLKNIFTNKQ
jgi:hypothetical protein